MAVPGEECRSTRGFQMKVRGILPITFVIFFLIGVLLYFFFFFSQYHDIWCYVPRVPRRVRLEAGGKCLPLNRQLTEPRVRWKVSSFCFGWFQVPGEFIVYPSANSINVGDYYSAPRR